MALVHLTARLNRAMSPELLDGWWRRRWISMRRVFPACLAAVLRTDHQHLLVEEESPERALRVWDNAVRGSTRGLGSRIWQIPREPVVVRDRNHLYKTVSYILRNPLAEDGVDEPLRWLWSTLRDVVGAVVDPWVSVPDLAAAMGRRTEGFERWFLEWVTVGPGGEPGSVRVPVPAVPTAVPRMGLDDLLAAVEAATRCDRRDVRRKRLVRWLFVALARRQGWRDVRALGHVAGVHPRSIYRIGQQPPRRVLEAVERCLGDARLLRSLPAPPRSRRPV